jgi:hypothetical protein
MVRKVVSIHEKTVQRAAKGDFKKPRRRRQSAKSSRVVTSQALDPLLVKWLKQHHVDYRSVEIVSPTQVIIR